MAFRFPLSFAALNLLLLSVASVGDAKAQIPEAALAGFEDRVHRLFRADAGKQLVRAEKKPPLKPGRGNYVRGYSYSIVRFAARCFYLDEMIDEANAALAENARHYLDNPKDINDRDSFHWHADIVMRLIEMYGSEGTLQPGRIAPETEALCLEPIWLYAKKCSWLGKADYRKSNTWHIYGSENHHAMDFTVNWHFAKLAKDRPEYRERKFDDGATAAEHYRTWNDYFVRYCEERAKKGVCVEMMSAGYNGVWLKGFYNFRDFGEERASRAAGMLLDLYWAYWAQEQIDGVDGGGKARVRKNNGFTHDRHGVPALGWIYFGLGQPPLSLNGELNAALSSYRPPVVVADIALNARADGPYEVRQRAQGLGAPGDSPGSYHKDMIPTKLSTDGGGIVRYSYCDPAFTMGTLLIEARPREDWASVSSQARWQGVIFAGAPGARIVPVVVPDRRKDVLNGQWSVQSQGSLITQKLKGHLGGSDMVIWISEEGLDEPVVENGIVFVEAEGAYAAVRTIGCTFRQAKPDSRSVILPKDGHCFIPGDEFAPVIVEVMSRKKGKNFAAFKKLVVERQPQMKGGVLTYRTLYGDDLTLDTSQQRIPTINGEPVDFTPTKVLQSPFLNADYNSGVVTIQKGSRREVLDFTSN